MKNNKTFRKTWRTEIVRRLKKSGQIKCASTINNIKDCGTVILNSGTQIKSGICIDKLSQASNF